MRDYLRGRLGNPRSIKVPHLLTMSTYKSLGGCGRLIVSNDARDCRTSGRDCVSRMNREFRSGKDGGLALSLLDGARLCAGYAQRDDRRRAGVAGALHIWVLPVFLRQVRCFTRSATSSR